MDTVGLTLMISNVSSYLKGWDPERQGRVEDRLWNTPESLQDSFSRNFISPVWRASVKMKKQWPVRLRPDYKGPEKPR